MNRVVAVVVLVALVLAGAGWWWFSQRGPGGRVAVERPVPDYVGGQACVSCHAQEAAAWQGSHHDLAMQRPGPETVLGDFDDATVTAHGVTSRFFREGETYKVETEVADGGRGTFDVAYVFGVEPLQQLLLQMPRGRLQAFTVCWDSRPADAGGQRWFPLYPDEPVTPDHPFHWTGRLHNWNHQCAECHSTDVRKNFDAQTATYSTEYVDEDVNCEACHGPGADHVAWAQGGLELPGGDRGLTAPLVDTDGGVWQFRADDPIARRSVPRTDHSELDLCARCHSRRSTLREDVPPGHPLGDSHRLALLEDGLYFDDGQIDDEVYVYGSFLQSRMHAEGVTCKDCHDPHSGRLVATGNALCATCHQPAVYDAPEHHFHPQGSEGAQCVACHMPERTYMEVDDRRDHSFRVPRPDLALIADVPEPCTGCHGDRDAAWAAAEIETRFGTERTDRASDVLARARARQPGYEDGLVAMVKDPAEPAIVRATGVDLLVETQYPELGLTVPELLRDENPWVRWAAVRAVETLPELATGQLGNMLTDPVRIVRTEAARVLAGSVRLGPVARVLRDSLLTELRASHTRNADLPEGFLNLGVLAYARGDSVIAERAYRRALDMDPRFTPAAVNLAEHMTRTGRGMDAIPTLLQLRSIDPDDADLAHALGLLLVRVRQKDAAVPHMADAARLRPESSRYTVAYAALLWDRDRKEEGFEVLREAVERRPGDRELLSALATLYQRDERIEEARTVARRLTDAFPNDLGARQLYRSLSN